MKTKKMKNLLALLLTIIVIPTMGQDYMNIYFHNGDFRKFYMKNITEVVSSKMDAEGVQHNDYDYQHITTIYDTYIYNLSDVDSITFTKIDEELAEQNFINAMPEIFNTLSDCHSIEDVLDDIEEIDNTEGVEEAWSDGHQLYVKIAEGEIYSFHFSHDVEFSNEAIRESLARTRALAPRQTSVAKSKESPLKAVIAIQQHKDDDRKEFIENYYYPLRDTLLLSGIEADYVASPTVDFFYDNCQKPNNAEHLNLYDYDIIFLVTHGSYSDLYYLNEHWYGDEVSNYNIKGHGISSSEELIQIKSTGKDDNNQPSDWVSYYNILKDWRDDSPYRDATDLHINIDFNHELRGDQWYWIGHPTITEYFFRDIAQGHFSNPNSIFFNSACQSLKGEEENASFSFADQFLNRGLGVYLGFSESDCTGKTSGPLLLRQMFAYGLSFETAYESLPLWMKEETIENVFKSGIVLTPEEEKSCRDNYKGAKLLFKFNPNNDEISSSLFIIPPKTEEVDKYKMNEEYDMDQTVTVNASITLLHPEYVDYGFSLTYHDPVANTRQIAAEVQPSDGSANVKFSTTFHNLERGRQYSYCAYTYDGLHYNYGNVCTFTIDKLADFRVAVQSMTLEEGECVSFDITSGNGSYTVESTDESVVTAFVEGETITLNAIHGGSAYVTVNDTRSGQYAIIPVTVAANLSLSVFGMVNLKQGDGVNVRIMSGNGSYSVRSTDERVATASIVGMFVSVQTLETGSAIIIVTDELTGQEASFTVSVTDLPAEAIDLGLPSGTLWASYNVGATSPEKYGDYFAWGETEGNKEIYFWTTYKHCDGVSNSNHDIGQNISGTDYDVAHVRWGGDWRMPTVNEFKELVYKCSYAETTLNGVKVFSFTGPNGKSIYLPAAGYKFNANEQEIGSGASYWSASLTTSINYAHELNISGGNVLWDCYINRFAGLPVRPVKDSGQSSYEPLALESTDPVALVVGKETTIDITSGNDSYTVESSNPSVVSATLSAWTSLATGEGGKCIWLKALAVGMAAITITDTWSQQTATLQVTITSDAKPVMEAVDLGLPSGTKWASCNVGATCPEEVGSYFAWGETEEKSSYSSDNYHVDIDLSVPYTDIAGTENDIAHVRWGGDWCMPTTFQQRELMNKCTSEWTTVNGVNGRRFIGPNGNSIFLPAAGMCFGDSLLYDGIYGYYWSSTQSADGTRQAYSFYITSKGRSWDNYSQLYYGLPIRPVHP